MNEPEMADVKNVELGGKLIQKYESLHENINIGKG